MERVEACRLQIEVLTIIHTLEEEQRNLSIYSENKKVVLDNKLEQWEDLLIELKNISKQKIKKGK